MTPEAVLLAAGQGTRLLPLTLTRPKCLVELGGVSLLARTLDNLAANGCEVATLVVGYRADQIRHEIGERHAGMRILYVDNPRFADTNNMHSLFLGLEAVAGPAWVVEADIVFEPALLEGPFDAEIAWLVDSVTRDMDGFYLQVDSDGRPLGLERVDDLAALMGGQAKSVGVLRLGASGVTAVRSWMGAAIAKGQCGLHYDRVLAEAFGTGRIKAFDVAGRRWFEVDTPADLREAGRRFPGRT